MSERSSGLFRLKPVDDLLPKLGSSEPLKRSMGMWALLFFSVGSIVGSGIFVILGTAIPLAGPAVLLSFALAAIAALFLLLEDGAG